VALNPTLQHSGDRPRARHAAPRPRAVQEWGPLPQSQLRLVRLAQPIHLGVITQGRKPSRLCRAAAGCLRGCAEESQMPLPRRYSWTERMVGAAKLDANMYEEVEADTAANGQAAGVVALVAVAQAIGSIGEGTLGLVTGVVAAIVGWLIWAGVTYLIGAKLLGGTATWGELLRTLGFAQTPGVLSVLGIIPVVGGVVRVAVTIWILIAGVIAIRQALDVSTEKAVLTAVLGWLVLALPVFLLGITAAGALPR
jgi:hypothetical protein